MLVKLVQIVTADRQLSLILICGILLFILVFFEVFFGEERLWESKFLHFCPSFKLFVTALEGDEVRGGACGIVKPEKCFFSIGADSAACLVLETSGLVEGY